jgi:hypothetical protein
MRERLQLLLGEVTDALPILTLHAFARRLLARPKTSSTRSPCTTPTRHFASFAGPWPTRTCRRHSGRPPSSPGLISDAKEQGGGPEALATVPDSPGQLALVRAYSSYQARLKPMPGTSLTSSTRRSGCSGPMQRRPVQAQTRPGATG